MTKIILKTEEDYNGLKQEIINRYSEEPFSKLECYGHTDEFVFSYNLSRDYKNLNEIADDLIIVFKAGKLKYINIWIGRDNGFSKPLTHVQAGLPNSYIENVKDYDAEK